MTLELIVALVAFLAVAGWRFLNRRKPRRGGPFPDVPDAPPTAEPLDAPGLSLPYSSLDPTAPPKRPVNWSQTKGGG